MKQIKTKNLLASNSGSFHQLEFYLPASSNDAFSSLLIDIFSDLGYSLFLFSDLDTGV